MFNRRSEHASKRGDLYKPTLKTGLECNIYVIKVSTCITCGKKNYEFTTPLGMIGRHLEVPATRHQDSAALGVKPVTSPSSLASFGSIFTQNEPKPPSECFQYVACARPPFGPSSELASPLCDLRRSLPYKRPPHPLEVSGHVRSVELVY